MSSSIHNNLKLRHRGWQFVGLDTSDGQRYEKIEIQPATFRWLDDYLPRLDKTKPTVVFTHFPLGLGVKYRPTNADALLDRFRQFNLQAVFNGHYHAFTERTAGGFTLTTNRCCAYRRDNHDQSKEKGYFVGEAKDGKITREFMEYQSPLPAYPGTENRRQRTEDRRQRLDWRESIITLSIARTAFLTPFRAARTSPCPARPAAPPR